MAWGRGRSSDIKQAEEEVEAGASMVLRPDLEAGSPTAGVLALGRHPLLPMANGGAAVGKLVARPHGRQCPAADDLTACPRGKRRPTASKLEAQLRGKRYPAAGVLAPAVIEDVGRWKNHDGERGGATRCGGWKGKNPVGESGVAKQA